MHPALYPGVNSCLPPWCAYSHIWVELRVLSIGAAHIFQSRPRSIPSMRLIGRNGSRSKSHSRPSCCAIPEAAGVPSHYTILRNRAGSGRKDILSLASRTARRLTCKSKSTGRSEIRHFARPEAEIAKAAAGLRPAQLGRGEPLNSKFGSLAIVPFAATQGTPRHCLGFVRAYDEPRLQLSGWFCQGGGGDFIDRSTLACALDRLTLLSAGSEPKVGALFAAGRTVSQLLRPARSNPGAHAEVPVVVEGGGEPPGAAPRRPLAPAGNPTQ